MMQGMRGKEEGKGVRRVMDMVLASPRPKSVSVGVVQSSRAWRENVIVTCRRALPARSNAHHFFPAFAANAREVAQTQR